MTQSVDGRATSPNGEVPGAPLPRPSQNRLTSQERTSLSTFSSKFTFGSDAFDVSKYLRKPKKAVTQVVTPPPTIETKSELNWLDNLTSDKAVETPTTPVVTPVTPVETPV